MMRKIMSSNGKIKSEYDDWYEYPTDIGNITIYEPDAYNLFTGLYDSEGNELWKEKITIGFDLRKYK